MEATYCDVCGNRAAVGPLVYSVNWKGVTLALETLRANSIGAPPQRPEDVCRACANDVARNLADSWRSGFDEMQRILQDPPATLEERVRQQAPES